MHIELIGITRFLRGSGRPEELVEFAGRICYRSEPRGDAGDFVMKRVREGHESIIEHLRFIFRLSSVPESELLEAYQHTQGMELTTEGQSAILSLNARSLRDLVRNSNSQLSRMLLETAAQKCPAIFRDLASETPLEQVRPCE